MSYFWTVTATVSVIAAILHMLTGEWMYAISSTTNAIVAGGFAYYEA